MTLSWFFILHLTLVSAGLLTRYDLQIRHRSGSRGQALPSTGCCLNQTRLRPLFARRGQYEQQRIRVPKPKVVPIPHNDLPIKVAPRPVKPSCSDLTQTCLPKSGCCDPLASCHCRFFNAICFCRRKNLLSKKTS